MTVIVYHCKSQTMCSDSRVSDEHGMHLTNAPKIYRLSNGALLGCAGDDDCRLLMEVLGRPKTPKQMPSRQELADTKTNFYGLLVFPKGHVFLVGVEFQQLSENEGEWTGYVSEINDKFAAVGSGQQYAYGALEVGASAGDAVRAACRRDLMCCLPVQSCKLVVEKPVKGRIKL